MSGTRIYIHRVQLLLYCHVSGGYDGNSRYDTILVYNPETEGWSPAGKMRKGRGEHAVTVVKMEKVAPYCQDVEQVEKSGCGAMKVSAAMVLVISLSIIWRQ